MTSTLSRVTLALAATGSLVASAPAAAAAQGTTCRTVTYTPPSASPSMLGELCVPAGRHRDVAVVLLHGGSGVTGSRFTLRDWQAQYNATGYPTLSIDYQLITPALASPIYPLPEQQSKAAVQYLRRSARSLHIRRDRIVVHGSSAGGRLAAQVMMTHGDPYFGGPQLYPVASDKANAMITLYGYFAGGPSNTRQYYGGLAGSPDPRVQERFRKADSVAQAARAPGPVMMFHGDTDTQVSIGQMRRMEAALRGAGKDVTAVTLPGVGHVYDHVRLTRGLTPLGLQTARRIDDWLRSRFPPRAQAQQR